MQTQDSVGQIAPMAPPLDPSLIPVATGGAIYLGTDDNILVTSFNAAAGVTLALRSRSLSLDNRFIFGGDAQTPNTDRTAKTTQISTPDGWLLGLNVFVTGGTPVFGQCYVKVELVRGLGTGQLVTQVICAGYVTAKQPMTWPGGPSLSSVDGPGAVRAIVGASPGAGAEFSETVPTGARWELIALHSALVTNATVANRIPVLILDDGANIDFVSPMVGNEDASKTWVNAWGQGTAGVFSATGLCALGSIPVNTRLVAGSRIRSSTVAIAAGDQWSAPKYIVREWIEGA
jgi:hypothetical protein